MTAPHPTLDRDTRRALRDELAISSNGFGDFQIMVDNGERDQFLAGIGTLQAMAGLLDAIGWSEQDGAPDVQPVAVTVTLAGWVAGLADALAGFLGESNLERDELDAALDALAGLRTLAAHA